MPAQRPLTRPVVKRTLRHALSAVIFTTYKVLRLLSGDEKPVSVAVNVILVNRHVLLSSHFDKLGVTA